MTPPAGTACAARLRSLARTRHAGLTFRCVSAAAKLWRWVSDGAARTTGDGARAVTYTGNVGGRGLHLTINGRFLLQDVTGVQKVALEFVAALDRLLEAGEYPSLKVELLAPTRGDLVSPPNLHAIELRRSGRMTGHAWEQLELPRLAGHEPLLCLGNLAPLTRLMSRRGPVHTMVHDLSYRYFPSAYSATFRGLYNAIIPAVLARSAHVFTVSESERRAIRDRYGRLISAERLTAVQNGGGEPAVDAQVVEDEAALAAGNRGVPARSLREPAGLYVGSLSRRKNARGIVEAAIALARGRGVDFYFVGATGSSLRQTGIDVPPDVVGRLHFLGQVNDPQVIEELYRRCVIFLFPSFYEASPLPPIEAMSFGCPVVCGDIPSLRERCGDAAVFVDPADHRSVVRETLRVIDDLASWDDLQTRGLSQASRYSWESQVRSVLQEITGG